MENSQSSSIPSSDESNESHFMTRESMDIESYKSLINQTLGALSSSPNELRVDLIAAVLEDCSIVTDQALCAVSVCLSVTEVRIDELTGYLIDAIKLLALLTEFIKMLDPKFMTCRTLQTFPTSVGMIIAKVSSHCKESIQTYGANLNAQEELLKDLFRNCHVLQSIYLTVLEKQFVFDQTNVDKKILLEALKINLKIGDTLRCLDSKALIVQWKATTEIYQKYGATLANTSIYRDCISVLCSSIAAYIKDAVEQNQDDKIDTRSIKIANFLLKTLMKVCVIFGYAAITEFDKMFDLLFYIHECSSHLQTAAERSQFKNLITSPSECMLDKLLSNKTFGNDLLNTDIKKIKREGKFLGFVVTITSAMDCVTQGHDNTSVTAPLLIDCLYKILPECNGWNVDVTLYENEKSVDLFDHLLIHSLALAMTLNCEDYNLLEKHMIEAILSTDHVSARFSTNIWALLSRDDPQLLFNQVIWLCKMYQDLENDNSMFHTSPQRIQLTHTIARLFSLMEDDDKMKICKQFRIHDDNNLSLWAALGVKSLPAEAKNAAQIVIANKLNEFQCLTDVNPDDIQKVIHLMNVAATCNITAAPAVEAFIEACLRAWAALVGRRPTPHPVPHPAPHSTPRPAPYPRRGSAFYFDYLQALIALTDSMCHQPCLKNVHLAKVLDYITELIQETGDEYKLFFINIICKMATTNLVESKLEDFRTAFTCLYQSGDIVRNKLIIALKEEYRHENIDKILYTTENETMRVIGSKIKHGIEIEKPEDTNFKYIHKCFEGIDLRSSSVCDMKKENSGNFDFTNVETLFGNENEIESPSQQVELVRETEAIITRLKDNTASLRAIKENVFSVECRKRIQKVCDELIIILSN